MEFWFFSKADFASELSGNSTDLHLFRRVQFGLALAKLLKKEVCIRFIKEFLERFAKEFSEKLLTNALFYDIIF